MSLLNKFSFTGNAGLIYLGDGISKKLNIPNNSTVVYANIIWGGYIKKDDIFLEKELKLNTPSNQYCILGEKNDENMVEYDNGMVFYSISQDITNIIKSTLNGVYSAQVDDINIGWNLIVVYQNEKEKFKKIDVYTGMQEIVDDDYEIRLGGYRASNVSGASSKIYAGEIVCKNDDDKNKILFGCTFNNLNDISYDTKDYCDNNFRIREIDLSKNMIKGQTGGILKILKNDIAATITSLASTIQMQTPVISFNQYIDKPICFVNDILNYNYTISNSGELAANNVIFKKEFLSNCIVLEDSFMLNNLKLPNNPSNGINIGMIPVGSSAQLNFSVKINENIQEFALKDKGKCEYEFNIGENNFKKLIFTNEVITNIEDLNIDINFKANKKLVNINNVFTYEIVLKNLGTLNVNNIILRDLIDENLEFVLNSVKINNILNNTLNPHIGISIGNLKVQEEIDVKFDVKVINIPNSKRVSKCINIQGETSNEYIVEEVNLTSNDCMVMLENAFVNLVQRCNKSVCKISDELCFECEVKNDGLVKLKDIIYKENINSSYEVISDSIFIDNLNVCMFNFNNGINIGELMPGEARIIKYKLRVNKLPIGKKSQHSFEISANSQNDIAEEAIKIQEKSEEIEIHVENVDVKINKKLDKSFLISGEILTYTIDISNCSSLNIFDVIYKEHIPNDFEYIKDTLEIDNVNFSISDFKNGIKLDCLGINEHKIIKFKVLTDKCLNKTYNSKGTISARANYNSHEISLLKDTKISSIQVEKANLDIKITSDKDLVRVNDFISYNLIIANTGSTAFTDVEIYNLDNENFELVKDSVYINLKSRPDININEKINIGDIEKSQVTNITFKAKVINFSNECSLNNYVRVKAFVKSDLLGEELIIEQKSNEHSVAVANPSLKVKNYISADIVTVGDVINYEVRVLNDGTLKIMNNTYRVVLPNGFDVILDSIRINDTHEIHDPTIGISIGDIDVGEIVNIYFDVKINDLPQIDTRFTKSAVKGMACIDNKSVVDICKESENVYINVQKPALEVTKTISKDYVNVGDILDVKIKIENTGTVEIREIILKDSLQSGLIFEKETLEINNILRNDLDINNNIYLGTLAIAKKTTINFKVKAIKDLTQSENILNIVGKWLNTSNFNMEVIEKNIQNDSVEIINPKLQLTPQINNKFARIGDIVNISIGILNVGNVDMEDVVIKSFVNQEMSFVVSSVKINLDPKFGVDIFKGINIGNIKKNQIVNINFDVKLDDFLKDNLMTCECVMHSKIKYNDKKINFMYEDKEKFEFKLEKLSLIVKQRCDKEYALCSDILTYSFLLQNNSSIEIKNVLFKNCLCESLEFIQESFSINELVLKVDNIIDGVNIGSIGPDSCVEINFKARVLDDIKNEKLVNNAHAISDIVVDDEIVDKDYIVHANEVVVMVEDVNLLIEKYADRYTAQVGDIITYTIDIKNEGSLDISSLVLIDEFSQATEFLMDTCTLNNKPKKFTKEIGINLGEISAKSTLKFQYKCKVVFLPTTEKITNSCVLGGIVKLNEQRKEIQSNVVELEQNIILAKLDIIKQANQKAILVNENIEYNISIRNVGNVLLRDILLTDMISEEAFYIPSTLKINGKVLSSINTLDNVNLKSLDVNESMIISYEVKVNRKPANDIILNKSFFTYSYFLNSTENFIYGNCYSNEVITNVDKLDVSLSKTIDKESTVLGDVITFNIDVKNDGTIEVVDSIIVDELPSNLRFINNTVYIDNVCREFDDLSKGIQLGDIKPKESKNITFKARVVASSEGGFYAVNKSVMLYKYILDYNSPVFEDKKESNEIKIKVASSNFKQIVITETFEVPASKPIINEIINASIDGEILNKYIIKTPQLKSIEGQVLTGLKMMVQGNVEIIVEYMSIDSSNNIYTLVFNQLFNTFIMLPSDCSDRNKINAKVCFEEFCVEKINELSIFLRAGIRVEAFIRE